MIRSLLLITDAWSPQTNGVVTTWQTVIKHLEASGVDVQLLSQRIENPPADSPAIVLNQVQIGRRDANGLGQIALT